MEVVKATSWFKFTLLEDAAVAGSLTTRCSRWFEPLPAPQAWVFAGSEWLGEASHTRACRAGKTERSVEVRLRGSFALRAQDFACGLKRPQPGSTWRGLTYPGLLCRQNRCREMFLEGWSPVGCNTWLPDSSLRWKLASTVVEIRVTSPVVNAGASPAGFSRTVVQRNRTTTLYTLVECSPF
jgi:hypothetical protein